MKAVSMRYTVAGLFSIALAACGADGGQVVWDTGIDPGDDTAVDTGVLDTAPDTEPDTAVDTAPDTVPDTTTDPACSSGNFNFFVMSLEAIQAAGGGEGLGGNLGGLAGADALCQIAADSVNACDKRWVAFLSATNNGYGSPVNAIDRIAEGPYYNKNGLLLAYDKAGLQTTRPSGDSTTVVYTEGFNSFVFTDCLTTELGNCNHSYGDSHDTLTGSNSMGQLYSTDPKYTCNDWTTTVNPVACGGGGGPGGECFPAIGHTWPAMSGQGWIFSHNAGGCQANINLTDTFEIGVGGHGGYGAWYCFGQAW